MLATLQQSSLHSYEHFITQFKNIKQHCCFPLLIPTAKYITSALIISLK